ncbi:unnamed protein product [Linum trigynum]|uniref:Uncharacterized protein n=1 Tax=Linum trigynum TaxID=586398 RepID=A0AAV2D7J1_9ROSI
MCGEFFFYFERGVWCDPCIRIKVRLKPEAPERIPLLFGSTCFVVKIVISPEADRPEADLRRDRLIDRKMKQLDFSVLEKVGEACVAASVMANPKKHCDLFPVSRKRNSRVFLDVHGNAVRGPRYHVGIGKPVKKVWIRKFGPSLRPIDLTMSRTDPLLETCQTTVSIDPSTCTPHLPPPPSRTLYPTSDTLGELCLPPLPLFPNPTLSSTNPATFTVASSSIQPSQSSFLPYLLVYCPSHPIPIHSFIKS